MLLHDKLKEKLHPILNETQNPILLYQILDRQVRYIDNEEMITELYRGGHGIILCTTKILLDNITNKIKEMNLGDIETLNSTEESSTSNLNIASPAGISESELSNRVNRSQSLPPNRKSVTITNKPNALTPPDKHKVWLYTKTTDPSAKYWRKGKEGEISISISSSQLFFNITENNKNLHSIPVDNLFSVNDSSCFYVFQTDINQYLGIGFNSRTASGLFRFAISQKSSLIKKQVKDDSEQTL